MGSTATGAFTIDVWEAAPAEAGEGVELSRTHIAKTFAGDLRGTSSGEFVMAQAPNGAAAYVGVEQVTATLDGRSGTFLLQHSASMTTSSQSLSIQVVPESGTRGLAGLSGTLSIDRDTDGGHAYTLRYELPS